MHHIVLDPVPDLLVVRRRTAQHSKEGGQQRRAGGWVGGYAQGFAVS